MTHSIGQEALTALRTALSGRYTLPVGDGNEAMIVCAPLPGRAVAAAARVDEVLWVVLDLDKPAAARHATAMLDEWRSLFLDGADFETGPTTEPCPLSLVS